MKVLITGASGLIGQQVGKKLAEKGHQLLVVSRKKSSVKNLLPFPCEVIEGDLNESPLKDDRLATVEGVINLMGETISGRWTDKKKEAIYHSRIIGTRNLVKSLPTSLQVLVQGSAVGAYGDRHDELLTEESSLGQDFLAKVCRDWEHEASRAAGRKVFVRTGIVLSQQGGAFPQMLFPFRLGFGGALGSGNQWMSWVHIEDISNLFVEALENPKFTGAINGTAPEPVTTNDLSKRLAQELSTYKGPAVPAFVLKLLFSEGADPILGSQRVQSRASQWGYKFRYAKLEEALKDLCEPYSQGEDILVAEQYFDKPPAELFEYFKEAHNLEEITPPTLKFKIEKISTPQVQQGTLIDYTLKVHGVPMKWRTEIDEWQPPTKFVDNQLKGPYRKWHHTHEFKPFAGGTLMTDRVRYKLPLGYLGWLLAGAFVRKDVQQIFSFRRKIIAEQFHPDAQA